jgi:hypothetical protein
MIAVLPHPSPTIVVGFAALSVLMAVVAGLA